MKKQLYLLSFLILGLIPHSFGMYGKAPKGKKFMYDLGDFADRYTRDIGKDLESARRAKEEQYREELVELNRDIAQATGEEKQMLLQQKYNLKNKHTAAQDRLDEFGVQMAGVVPNMLNAATEIVKEEAMAQSRLEQTAINAEATKEASIANTKQYIKALKDPKNAKLLALTATGIALGICAAWHGTKLLSSAIQQYFNKIPTIAEETSLVSIKEKISNFLARRKLESDISDVVLEKNLAERVSKIASTVKNTVANAGFFQHMLFYGPPGTGKTMLAKRIARSSGLEYIYFAGGSALEQLETEAALSRLTELFEFAKRSPKKLMIIIDEAEVLLADRSKKLSDKTRKLLNLVLGYTGTEQSNFIVVALTNLPKDLDAAFLSRCDEQIEIGVPGPEERVKILELYVSKLLMSRVAIQARPSLFARLFGAKVAPKRLTVETDALSKDALAEIAQKLDGFVGRDISKLVISLQSQAYASATGRITKQMVEDVVKQKVAQKELQKTGFKSNKFFIN